MALSLSLPTLETNPSNPPEVRPAKVGAWLDNVVHREPAEAARVAGDALAATNRVAVHDARRLDLAERYWDIATELWPMLEQRYAHAAQPLTGDALEAAKAALTLSHELTVAFKHLLAREARPRLLPGSGRNLPRLLQRSLEGMARTVTACYRAYSPIPPKTWLDAHRIYDFARERNLHQQPLDAANPQVTLEAMYVRMLLLALANPYGLLPGQLDTVLQYLDAHAHWAKLTDIAPVHRMAKAVAIVPVGHDFPPFSANKGGTIEGRKMFLLTYDLAFQIQEQLRGLEAGAAPPLGVGRGASARLAYLQLLRRLLRQWAIPPARQFNRVPSRARVMACAGIEAVWQATRETEPATRADASGMTICQVINHTPAGYALRQSEGQASALRIGDVIALERRRTALAPAGAGALVPQHDERQRARVRLRAPVGSSGARPRGRRGRGSRSAGRHARARGGAAAGSQARRAWTRHPRR